ncbi:MAG: ROK family protein, partial [Rhodoglobus sp.]|nr:ROK family protein [Rhodoglobus sp.]
MTVPHLLVGIDIGGTKTDAVAIDSDGVIAERLRLPTGFGPDAVLETARTAVATLTELTGVPVADFASIGIGIPGAVDSVTGRVAHAVNLGLDDLDLGGELARTWGRPVRVDNDVNAAAVGAFHLMERDPSHSMAYLNLGTGLAAGIVLGGRVWRGARGTAGEIGHIPVDPNGPECPCGQRGCLEMVASGSSIARLWPTADERPASALFAAAEAGDLRALEIRQRFTQNVAAAVRMLVLTVDVDSVVLGGGLSTLGSPLLDDVVGVLADWEHRAPLLASIELSSRVAILPADFPAAAVGAARVGLAEAGDS